MISFYFGMYLLGSKKKSPRKKNLLDPKPNPNPNLTITLTLTVYGVFLLGGGRGGWFLTAFASPVRG